MNSRSHTLRVGVVSPDEVFCEFVRTAVVGTDKCASCTTGECAHGSHKVVFEMSMIDSTHRVPKPDIWILDPRALRTTDPFESGPDSLCGSIMSPLLSRIHPCAPIPKSAKLFRATPVIWVAMDESDKWLIPNRETIIHPQMVLNLERLANPERSACRLRERITGAGIEETVSFLITTWNVDRDDDGIFFERPDPSPLDQLMLQLIWRPQQFRNVRAMASFSNCSVRSLQRTFAAAGLAAPHIVRNVLLAVHAIALLSWAKRSSYEAVRILALSDRQSLLRLLKLSSGLETRHIKRLDLPAVVDPSKVHIALRTRPTVLLAPATLHHPALAELQKMDWIKERAMQIEAREGSQQQAQSVAEILLEFYELVNAPNSKDRWSDTLMAGFLRRARIKYPDESLIGHALRLRKEYWEKRGGFIGYVE